MMTSSNRILAAAFALSLVVGWQSPGSAQVGGSGGASAGGAVTIQSATLGGAASATFEGMGGSSGAAVRVKVKRNPGAPDPLTVTIPPGTVLRSSSSSDQSMVVSALLGEEQGNGMYRPMSQLVVRGTQTVTAILSAYCAEFEKDNPSPSTSFTLQDPNPTLACIARESRGLSVPAEQAAVWMVTDRITYKHMSEKFDISVPDWNAAQAVVQRCGVR